MIFPMKHTLKKSKECFFVLMAIPVFSFSFTEFAFAQEAGGGIFEDPFGWLWNLTRAIAQGGLPKSIAVCMLLGCVLYLMGPEKGRAAWTFFSVMLLGMIVAIVIWIFKFSSSVSLGG